MSYYNIEVKQSFNISYKFHIQKIAEDLPSYAVHLANLVRKKFNIIQLFPFSNPVFNIPNDDNIYRKVVINKRYHLIYTVKEKTVYVLYFSDGRQSPSTYFNLLDIFKSLN